jgi:hypothetical protein
MSNSRRDFLKRGTLMAVAAGVPLALTEKASAFGLEETSQKQGLKLAAFKSQLGSNFMIHNEGSKVSVKLIDVTNLASAKDTQTGKEGFSLVFKGPGGNVLKQDTFVIEHAKLGKFSFLLVPIRFKNNSAPHYEAVINHLCP